MLCKHCGNIAVDKHHVIKRGKNGGGLDNNYNMIPLCRTCHNAVHHSKNSHLRREVLKTCYDYIRPNLSLCWSAIYEPKIVRLIRIGEL